MNDFLQIATCYDDTVRIYACDTTKTIKEAQEIHNLWPTSCAALGRLLTMGLIMSSMQKANEHITIIVDGGGAIGRLTVEAHDCIVRGYCHNPGVYLTKNDGNLAVGYGVGNNGTLTVIKDLGLKNPFTSTINLTTGEITDDFNAYFLQSEQAYTAISLGVMFDTEGKALTAGGFLVQLLPNCKEETINILEEKLKEIKGAANLLKAGNTPLDIINFIADGKYKLLGTKELKYGCDCSLERFKRALVSLGKDELNSMINDNKPIEINCNFCNKKYSFAIETLKELEKLSK